MTAPSPQRGAARVTARPWRAYTAAALAYTALSFVVWAHLWGHPATVTTCGCGDGALTLWVLEWPAHALAHGTNPFYSADLFHPAGIDMAPNSLGLGVVFAPVTWLFGPVATLNVITTLSAPLSALAMFWFLRRLVSSGVAAFVGGLFFGFSPFVLVSLALAHPNFGLLAPVPLVAGALDELLRVRRRSPVATGAVLGVLLAVEFFVSVEVLLLVVTAAAVTIGVLAALRAVAARRSRDAPRRPWRADAAPVATGLGVAALVAAVALAYPVWCFFYGPGHLVGRAWPNSPAGTVGATLGGFVHGGLSAPLVGVMHLFGGYQGPALPLPSFLGIGALVVAVGGCARWPGDARLRLFGIGAVVCGLLALGVGGEGWLPWRLLTHVPVLVNVVPINLSALTDLCMAVVLAVTLDRLRPSAERRPRPLRLLLPWAAAALAVVPVAVALAPNVPMAAVAVRVPTWFEDVAPHLPAGRVVLPYPAALGGIQSSMAWQAVEGIPFAMVGGGGPGVVPSRAGAERPGFDVLAAASLPLSPSPPADAATLAAVRAALAGWGVTTVVVPDEPGLPTYDRGRPVDYAVGLFTAAIGRAPVWQAGAWVWNGAGAPAAPPARDPARITACTADSATPARAVAACVLGLG